MYSYQIKPHSNRGFIALISVVILGFVLMLAVITLGSRGINSRFTLLDLERKDSSKALAEGCAQVAIVEIINGSATPSSYPKMIWVDPERTLSCQIVSVTLNTPAGFDTIRTTASSSGATTNMEVVWNIAGDAIASTREVPNF